MTDEQAVTVIGLLTEIRDELRSWKEVSTECPHPEDQRQDLSSMGEKWIRCRQCKQDLIHTEKRVG